VVASAVILHPHYTPPGIRDSKALSSIKRELLSKEIRKNAHVGIGICSVEEIDSMNILQASLCAMERAVHALPITPSACLIDGNKAPTLSCKAKTVVKGDAISVSIAAASIIAKTIRDQMMIELAAQYPAYQWERNKGYGVKAHQDGLASHGVSPHHRRSFAPIRNLLS